MKKVLLSSVAALAVFAAAAPAFANDNPAVNGGANTPRGPQDTDVASKYYGQTEFVNADKVNEYLAQHAEDIDAEAAQDPAVVAAKAELDAVEGGSHLYGEKKAAYESALNTARNNVRNKYVQELQKKWNTASKKEGNFYILNETPEQKNARYLAEHGLTPEQAQAQAQDKAKAQEEAKKAEDNAKASKNGKAASAQAGKALPKTSAVK